MGSDGMDLQLILVGESAFDDLAGLASLPTIVPCLRRLSIYLFPGASPGAACAFCCRIHPRRSHSHRSIHPASQTGCDVFGGSFEESRMSFVGPELELRC